MSMSDDIANSPQIRISVRNRRQNSGQHQRCRDQQDDRDGKAYPIGAGVS